MMKSQYKSFAEKELNEAKKLSDFSGIILRSVICITAGIFIIFLIGKINLDASYYLGIWHGYILFVSAILFLILGLLLIIKASKITVYYILGKTESSNKSIFRVITTIIVAMIVTSMSLGLMLSTMSNAEFFSIETTAPHKAHPISNLFQKLTGEE